MVQAQPDTGTLVSESLLDAGLRLAEAKRSWAESFLFYYNQPGRGGKPRTVAEAEAMATIDVDVTRAVVEWEYYLHATES